MADLIAKTAVPFLFMHILKLAELITNPELAAGTYVASDMTCAEILAMRQCTILGPGAEEPPFDPSLDWNGKRILVVRQGAIGDLLFLTPALREIKKRWPVTFLDVACFDRLKPVLAHNPDVDNVITNPIEQSLFYGYDARIWLDDNFFEETVEAKTVHAVDLVLNRMNLTTANKELRYEVTFEEKAAAWTRFPKGGWRKRIGIQLSASTPTRTWPREYVHHFAGVALNAGHDVFYFGWPGETGNGSTPPPDHLCDLTRENPPLSFRESCAVLSTCDGVVAPDSSLLHVAGALGIPTIGLFGSFPSALRTAYAKSIKAIDGTPIKHTDGHPCGPCQHHCRPGNHQFPLNSPCSTTGECEVLKTIDPKRVVKMAEKLMRKYSSEANSAQ